MSDLCSARLDQSFAYANLALVYHLSIAAILALDLSLFSHLCSYPRMRTEDSLLINHTVHKRLR